MKRKHVSPNFTTTAGAWLYYRQVVRAFLVVMRMPMKWCDHVETAFDSDAAQLSEMLRLDVLCGWKCCCLSYCLFSYECFLTSVYECCLSFYECNGHLKTFTSVSGRKGNTWNLYISTLSNRHASRLVRLKPVLTLGRRTSCSLSTRISKHWRFGKFLEIWSA